MTGNSHLQLKEFSSSGVDGRGGFNGDETAQFGGQSGFGQELKMERTSSSKEEREREYWSAAAPGRAL